MTFIICLLSVALLSCKKDPAIPIKGITELSTEEQDNNFLTGLYEEIYDMSTSIFCTDPLDWKFTGIGAKPCGGPSGYIAYSKKLNEQAFLEKVRFYNSQLRLYNQKSNLFSDCSIVNPPSGVDCNNGKPVLVF